ncbi:MAG: hypothetical protein PHV99_03220 [Candidatus Pacebacteria bacterium]|nr:hypothetical protein [Candidatus Paceibacterota bacterium]
MRLLKIPPEIQQIYNIGSELDVETDNSVSGGHFTFINKDGREMEMDAVEIYGQGIEYEML